MTLIIRQLRALIFETPIRQKKSTTTDHNNKSNRRKSLSVKISKEPPAIVYFERDNLEDSFECIFDPKVCHDEEKDHPDLFVARKKDLKPWQKPPYCSNKISSTSNLVNKFKSTFNHNSNTKSTLLLQ